jgi:RNA polymerase sigma factor (sigma-70 family)
MGARKVAHDRKRFTPSLLQPARCSRELKRQSSQETSANEDAVVRGDARIETLYREHLGDAVRLAYLLTGDGEAAKDLAQDAFVRAAGRLTSLRAPDAFRPYLRRAVVNACISYQRRLAVRRSYLERHGGDEPTASMPNVEEHDAVIRAIAVLPVRQRTAVVLRYWADLSETDMAAALSCTVPAVRGLLHRALATLRSRSDVEG